MNAPSHPLLIVISGPSGSGKTTLCNRLVDEFSFVSYSVSCTTRPPRPGEVDGTSYHFMEEAVFRDRLDKGEFLEHAVVHGFQYGTLRHTVYDALAAGRDILMDIDVQGAEQMRAAASTAPSHDLLRKGFVDVFISPPSLDVLNQRLRDRGQDGSEVIARRMHNANGEMTHWKDYMYHFVNDTLDRSYDTIRAIVIAEHHRLRATQQVADVR